MTRRWKVARGAFFGTLAGLLSTPLFGTFWWLGTSALAFTVGYIGTDWQGFWRGVKATYQEMTSPLGRRVLWASVRISRDFFLIGSAFLPFCGLFLIIAYAGDYGLARGLTLISALPMGLCFLLSLWYLLVAPLFHQNLYKWHQSDFAILLNAEREMVHLRPIAKQVNAKTAFTKLVPLVGWGAKVAIFTVPDLVRFLINFAKKLIVKVHTKERTVSGIVSATSATVGYIQFGGSPIAVAIGSLVGFGVGWLYEVMITPIILNRLSTNSAN
ncbi:MAG: hypothetical protein BRC25_01690 [Parcubacteria group bacterium SW_6_46_9]|nr:MAG: hypothetical protein BRC25_01690 [Parcubacteria group bacterium SW_6_46_9]